MFITIIVLTILRIMTSILTLIRTILTLMIVIITLRTLTLNSKPVLREGEESLCFGRDAKDMSEEDAAGGLRAHFGHLSCRRWETGLGFRV